MYRVICGQRSLVMLLCQEILYSRSRWQMTRQHEHPLCICARCHSIETENYYTVDKIKKQQKIDTIKSVKCTKQEESKKQQDQNKNEHTHEQQFLNAPITENHNQENCNKYDNNNNEDYEEEVEEDKRYVPQWFNKQVLLDDNEFVTRPITEYDIFPRGRWYGHKIINKRQDAKQSEKNKSGGSMKIQRDIFNRESEHVYDKYAKAQEEEARARDAVMGKSNEELFPNWTPDEEAPRKEFMQLNPSLQTQYIYNRLSMAERRIRLAPDFGATGLAVYLHYGDLMLNECESLLNELGWMTKSLQSRINEIKALSLNHKIENDLL